MPIIKRNTPLPVKMSEVFYTMVDGQQKVDVRIYQGEAPLVPENTKIGNFMIEDLSDVPSGNEIVLELSLDLSGILKVTAIEKRTGLEKTVRMETEAHLKPFDLNKARQNLQEIIGNDADTETPAEIPDTEHQAAAKAGQLQKRLEQILPDVDSEDQQELTSLMRASREAMNCKDWTTLQSLNESLEDMLFYLED